MKQAESWVYWGIMGLTMFIFGVREADEVHEPISDVFIK